MRTFSRSDRVAKLIQTEVSTLFLNGLKDNRIGFVTITGVSVSKDLKNARIFYSTYGSEVDIKKTRRGISSATPYIQHSLGQSCHLKYIPRISFSFDETLSRADRIDQILHDIRDETV